MLLAEKVVRTGGRGHVSHGLTEKAAEELARQAEQIGFVQVSTRWHPAGRRPMLIVEPIRGGS